MPEPSGQSLLTVAHLSVEFRHRRRVVRAVHDVSMTLAAGETLGLVGESGSGKTTIGRAILGLTAPTRGTISYRGQQLGSAASRRSRRGLSDDLQVIFQDPYSSLNPARKIGASLVEAAASRTPPDHARRRMLELLERVGLAPSAADHYPSQFSGGQRQRIAVARALMPSPRIVICDEPLSALDVSVQAQVLNLLMELQREASLAYVFISHDLDVVRLLADRVMVLFRGQVLEHGPTGVVAERPRSPYTQALLAASRGLSGGVGVPPDTHTGQRTQADGCPFAPRCPLATELCWQSMPALAPSPGGGEVACHHSERAAAVASATSPSDSDLRSLGIDP